MTRFPFRAIGVVLIVALCGSLFAADPAAPPSAPAPAAPSATEAPAEPAAPPALKEYKGREIAQTMHYTGAEWLIRDNRELEERTSLVVANLGLKPGQTVCDMGAGNGYYSLKLAKLVGEHGKVLAVDIQPEMLRMLKDRSEKEGVSNVEPVLGLLYDPKLPEGKVDLILCVDVYHEFSHPEHMLAGMRKALAPHGQLVLVEYRAEDPKVPIKPLHKMSKEQILKELPPNGFKLAKQFEGLPWQHMMFFERDEAFDKK